jgi:hypothetical protein
MVSVPAKLAALLETLPSEERQEIAAWLFAGGPQPRTGPWFDPTWSMGTEQILSMGTVPFPVGENTQLSTVRLPTESHTRLREWCSNNGFTMAAVIRGLVERFLEEQTRERA